MTQFASPPGDVRRNRDNGSDPRLGIGVLPNAPGLAILPPDTGATLAAQLEAALGLVGEAVVTSRAISEAQENRRLRAEQARERLAADRVSGLLLAGDPQAAQAEVERLVASGEISAQRGLELFRSARSELNRIRAETDARRHEIEQEQRGVGVAQADLFLADEVPRILRGETDTLIPDGAEIGRVVRDRLESLTADLPEETAKAFIERAEVPIRRAHAQAEDRRKRVAVNESIEARANTLYAAKTDEEREAIIQGVRDLAARTSGIVTEREAISRVALQAANLHAAIDGDLEAVNRLARLVGGEPGGPLGKEFEAVRLEARARADKIMNENKSRARQEVLRLVFDGVDPDTIDERLRELVERGELDPSSALPIRSEIEDVRNRKLRHAQAEAIAAQIDLDAKQLATILANPDNGVTALMVTPATHRAGELETTVTPRQRLDAAYAARLEQITGRQGSNPIMEAFAGNQVDPTHIAEQLAYLKASGHRDTLIEGALNSVIVGFGASTTPESVPRHAVAALDMYERIRGAGLIDLFSLDPEAEVALRVATHIRLRAGGDPRQALVAVARRRAELADRGLGLSIPKPDPKALSRAIDDLPGRYNNQAGVEAILSDYYGIHRLFIDDDDAAMEAAVEGFRKDVVNVNGFPFNVRELRHVTTDKNQIAFAAETIINFWYEQADRDFDRRHIALRQHPANGTLTLTPLNMPGMPLDAPVLTENDLRALLLNLGRFHEAETLRMTAERQHRRKRAAELRAQDLFNQRRVYVAPGTTWPQITTPRAFEPDERMVFTPFYEPGVEINPLIRRLIDTLPERMGEEARRAREQQRRSEAAESARRRAYRDLEQSVILGGVGP